MKPTIYIAAPLFNPEQLTIIKFIEDCLTNLQYPFRSPRISSEPFVPKGTDRDNPQAWNAVFDQNEKDIVESDLILAILDYSMPQEKQLGVATDMVSHLWGEKTDYRCSNWVRLFLTDNGVCWEMGFARGLGKIVIGFSLGRATSANVMLTKGCDGLISGWTNLNTFFIGQSEVNGSTFQEIYIPKRAANRIINLPPSQMVHTSLAASYFDWTACEEWTSQQEVTP